MDRLTELIKAIRNRCEIYLALQDNADAEKIKHAIPTLLEDLHEDSQEIIYNYCVKQFETDD